MMTIAEKLTKIAENEPKIYDAGKKSLYDKLARCREVGETVLIAKALGMEQPADVSVSSKNLIPYPYTDTTKTVNGVTFTDNGDGTITVNGTASDTANFMCLSLSSLGFKKGIYTLTSGIGNDNSGLSYGAVLGYLYSGNTRQTAGTKNGNCTVSLSQDAMCDVVLTVRSGVTVNNLVFKPQLEPGMTATAYTPYVAGLSAVSVKKYGKNLIPYPYTDTTKTANGITFTDNGDGSVTANGTATADVSFGISNALNTSLPKGAYVLSGCPDDGSANRYFQYYSLKDGNTTLSNGYETGNGALIDLPGRITVMNVFINVKSGVTVNNLVFRPQLEPGDAATEYEPYKAPAIYTPDASGKVTGATLDESTSFFTTDTAGVLLTVEYSSDYNAGQKNAYDAFWDALQDRGKRDIYSYLFMGQTWTAENFKLKYPIKPSQMAYAFYQNTIPGLELSGSLYDFSVCALLTQWLYHSEIVKVPKIYANKLENGCYHLFNGASKLVTVTELAFPNTALTYSSPTLNAFTNCTALENIKITGVIANTGFDLHWSTRLTIESLTSILSALSKDSGIAAGKSITLPTAAQAKINADTTAKAQYDSAIAAGWTIAFA
mgnify:CR=1 FL=1